jgi:hypothetical protein
MRTRYPPGMASSYEVTVTAAGRKQPLMRYVGPVDDPQHLAVRRDAGQVLLVMGRNDSAPVVLGIAKDPGGELTATRRRQEKDAKPVSLAVH